MVVLTTALSRIHFYANRSWSSVKSEDLSLGGVWDSGALSGPFLKRAAEFGTDN